VNPTDPGAERSDARERILARVREALAGRKRADHPGDFGGWRTAPYDGRVPAGGEPVDGFAAMLTAAGGEAVRMPTLPDASAWLQELASTFESATVGATVPAALRPRLAESLPVDAALGVSMARAAIAETGSLVLDARDGRRSQLLAPTHVVFVRDVDVHATFREALLAVRTDLPSAIGLHSGPSKSADIGHIMVKGVHGPGRLIAVIIGA
jgi:L-lactate dehydrogenase complex protein LldG